MVLAGASFHKRMAEGENEALRMLVLRDGTRNFWSCPLSLQGLQWLLLNLKALTLFPRLAVGVMKEI